MKPFFYLRINTNNCCFRIFAFSSLLLIIHPSNLYSKNIRSLKKQKIESLEIIYDKSQLRNAGNNFPFGVEVKLKNNKTVKTKGFLNGTVRWKNFEIEVLGGKYFLGNIYIPGKKDLVKPDFVIVVIRSKYHDNIYTRKRIELNYLTKIEMFSTKNFNKAPGNRIYPGIVKTFNNNQKEVISQQRLVDKEMDNFEIICEGGNFSSGRFIISNNIFNITNHHVSFSIYHKKNAELNTSFSTTLDYIDDFTYIARGSSGADGNAGTDGSDGSDGGTGSNGQNGSDGSNGNHGSDGDDGPNLEVYADAYFDSILQTDLIKVVIYNLENNKESYYYVNPKGGSIKIYTIGGEGGDGGNGGDGGDAGDGGNGESTKRTITKTVPCGNGETCEETETIVEVGKGGNGGNGGNGGSGGNGGDGGYGGDIYAYFSYKFAPYEHIIELESLLGDEGDAGNYGDGGNGGDGGTPSGSDGSSGSDGRKGNSGDEGCHGEIFIYDWDGWLDF